MHNYSTKSSSDSAPSAAGVNLRDVGDLSQKLQKEKLFRSSQAVRPDELAAVGLRAVIDLRRRKSECGQAEDEFLRQLLTGARSIARVPGELVNEMVPETLKPEVLRQQPVVCEPCSEDSHNMYGSSVQVFHVDLVNRATKWSIFYGMPRFIKYKVLRAMLTCTPPEEIMAPAVADDELFGYLKLYETLLDTSKMEWARALRVLTRHNHVPALIHCIHGKDRTGLLVVLLAGLCHVERQVVIDDYVASEALLREGREAGVLGLPSYLSDDQVIAAKREVIVRTLEYLDQNYGGVEGYCRNIGLTALEVAAIRVLLMVQPPEADVALVAGQHEQAHTGGPHGLLHMPTLDPRRLFRQSGEDEHV